MKKVLLFFAVVAMAMTTMAQEKVAILETVDKSGTISPGIKLMVRQALTSAISNTPGYESLNRANRESVAFEQAFQRSGNVSDEQIKELGAATGASYVLVSEVAYIDATNIMISVQLLDVVTFGVKSSAWETSGTSTKEVKQACKELTDKLLKSVVTTPKKTKTQQEGPIGTIQLRYDNRFNSNVAIQEDGHWVKCKKDDVIDYLTAYSSTEVSDLYLRGWQIKRRWRIFELIAVLGTAGFGATRIIGNWHHHMENNKRDRIFAIIGGTGVFSVLLTECIAVPIGKKKMKKALGMYNNPTLSDNMTFSFGVAPNGIGMTLNF